MRIKIILQGLIYGVFVVLGTNFLGNGLKLVRWCAHMLYAIAAVGEL